MLNDICKNCLVTHYRIASLIGPGFDQRITNILIKNLINGIPLKVVDGAQVMGYMDVRDAANAIAAWEPVGVITSYEGYTYNIFLHYPMDPQFMDAAYNEYLTDAHNIVRSIVPKDGWHFYDP